MSAGLLVMFESEPALCAALERLSGLQLRELRTYTPKPLELEPPRSPLPLIVLIAGLLCAAAGFGMQLYANARSYPLDIGGRPENSWPAFIPITFELGVLAAVLAGVFGYFVINRMPRLYDRIDELDGMREAMRDGWLVALRTNDPERLQQARNIVEQLKPISVEELME
jgi:ABC-type Fe3+ transport system permease subunit